MVCICLYKHIYRYKCLCTHTYKYVIYKSYILDGQAATSGVNSPKMLTGDKGSWFNCSGLLKVNATLAILIIGFDYLFVCGGEGVEAGY